MHKRSASRTTYSINKPNFINLWFNSIVERADFVVQLSVRAPEERSPFGVSFWPWQLNGEEDAGRNWRSGQHLHSAGEQSVLGQSRAFFAVWPRVILTILNCNYAFLIDLIRVECSSTFFRFPSLSTTREIVDEVRTEKNNQLTAFTTFNDNNKQGINESASWMLRNSSLLCKTY